MLNLLLATFIMVSPPDWTHEDPNDLPAREVAVHWWASDAQGQHLHSSTVYYMQEGQAEEHYFPLPAGTYYCVRAWAANMRTRDFTYSDSVCGEAR